MLDLKFIRENKEAVKKNAADRGAKIDVDRLLALDEERRKNIVLVEALRAKQNKASDEIAREKDATAKQAKIAEMKKAKEEIGELEPNLKKSEEELDNLMRLLPNMMQPGTPVGTSEKDNVVVREVGKKTNFKFAPRDYMAIAESLDLIDVERAAKVSGSRFGYIKNEAAQMEFALAQLALEVLVKEGFQPIITPVMIRSGAMAAMGYIDTAEDKEERYFFPGDDLYLVGTSEQAIGPMYQNEVLDIKKLPLRFVGFSACFRREAGSYGKDTKGILRVHQFDKLEMFSFTRPEDSAKEHQFLISIEEKLMQKLKLPYRLMQLCSIDFARPSSATYDIETWLPGQNNGTGEYRETHSCSNCTDWQSRRLNIKYKNEQTGKTELVHMLNGTAFAIGRILIAILENYQQKDGSVEVPKALRPWMGGVKKIKPKK
ncbi:MAG TPA: serine--tRNA ligase [Candidatus Portnoybacteria bacterium]|nr:serine--tRNA ligase [Candidatus Portnoybacteria bacterium]